MLSVTKIFRTTDAQIDLIMYDPLFFNKLHLPHTKEVNLVQIFCTATL